MKASRLPVWFRPFPEDWGRETLSVLTALLSEYWFSSLGEGHWLEAKYESPRELLGYAAMESFFGSLKKESIRRRKYRTRDEARSDVFDCIEAFYNRKRRHRHLGGISPDEFEKGLIAS
jgi:transposase InsO family protein